MRPSRSAKLQLKALDPFDFDSCLHLAAQSNSLEPSANYIPSLGVRCRRFNRHDACHHIVSTFLAEWDLLPSLEIIGHLIGSI